MTRPPGRRGGGGRGPRVRGGGGGRGCKANGKGSGCLVLVMVGSGLMLTSGLAGLALAMATR